MKWKGMDPEAAVVGDLVFLCVVILVAISVSPWLALGLMVGGFVTVRIAYAEAPREVREQRHRLRESLWRAGDRRR